MRVLITGCSPGIGGATCLALAEAAARATSTIKIAACEIRQTEEFDALIERLTELGAEVLALTGDLADPEVPARLVTEAAKTFGGLDGVVANAGITSPAPLAELALDEWDRLFDVNVRAAWLLAKAGYPHLKKSRGSFVGIGSISGINPHAGMGAYSATKAAIIMLCRQLAQEWGPDGARANAVSPGMIRTPLTAAVYSDNTIARQRAELVPYGRVGEARDIANAVAFLLGPEAEYITGQNLCVDGGFAGSINGHIPGLPKSATA